MLSLLARPARLFWQLGRFLAIFVIALAALMPGVAAEDPAVLEQMLPRTFAGEFKWYGSPIPQKVEIKLNRTQQLDGPRIEGIGCGRYDVSGLVTSIGIRMMIDAQNLEVEIWEFSPAGSASFTIDGSHKGKIIDDLQGIDAEWTTRSTGQKGRLQLRAGGAMTCSAEIAFAR